MTTSTPTTSWRLQIHEIVTELIELRKVNKEKDAQLTITLAENEFLRTVLQNIHSNLTTVLMNDTGIPIITGGKDKRIGGIVVWQK